MKYAATLLTALGIALGIFFIVYGGQDDSPGAQLMGAAMVLGAVVYGLRSLRPPTIR